MTTDSNIESLLRETNYFICTIGQAGLINAQSPHKFSTINKFIDEQALSVPDLPAVGFPIPPQTGDKDASWTYRVVTFAELQRGGNIVAHELSQTVLPCTNLAGRAVERYREITDAPRSLKTALTPFCSKNLSALEMLESAPASFPDYKSYWPVKETDLDVLYHTSGTSGMPKPIPQTQYNAIGVLPCLSKGRETSSFTTTPLYHGGMADVLRAWTSSALIWLFPGKDVPITPSNILKSIHVAQDAAQSGQHLGLPPIRYFSSVPFVLQMLAADEEGMKILKSMDIVGVGGAALPATAGDDLAAKGVNLISRYGILLQSHRDYDNDREWQYLRATHGSESLRFERQGDGTSELVVLPGWPRMTKTNRPDGSYATSDLFAPHPSIPNAWKYQCRADSQLALSTGKKFDPAPMEAALSSSSLLDDVLIFGNGRPFAGALLFPSKSTFSLSDNDLIKSIWPEIEKLNSKGQPHARLGKGMLQVVHLTDSKLEKSSKGTILRAQAEREFQQQIIQAYEKMEASVGEAGIGGVGAMVSDDRVLGAVSRIVHSVMDRNEQVPEDADLFSHGLDSVACMQIRSVLQKMVPTTCKTLPLNVVYDCGTIGKLAEFIIRFRSGQNVEDQDELRHMLELIEHHSIFEDRKDQSDFKRKDQANGTASRLGHVVVLTGATGALGAHILDLLRSEENISETICLVRGKDSFAAHERVNKSLLQRGKSALDSQDDRIKCLTARLGEKNLGLSPEIYQRLADRVTIILHAAWAVNFSLRLGSFVKDHIGGLENLINFALSGNREEPPSVFFCSSTATVISSDSISSIPESLSHDPTTASPLGYSRSKWVAEGICSCAYENTRLRGHIGILRIGQLCGDTEGGIWNVTEAWPLMLSSVKVTGALPRLDEPLSWLPVDVAAKAALQIATKPLPVSVSSEIPVYHLVNNSKRTRWTDLLQWMRSLESTPFDIVDPRQWISRLEGLTGEAAKHPARKLLGLWKSAYASEKPQTSAKEEVSFELEKTQEVAPVMREVQPVNEKHFRLIYGWMEREMML
ncbi:MAG: putative secondary metabolism biosynthetic enzyme [Peltula sp. TS41687]|nr:MAG: putative secondary metabolism biosynthetic enzyme [Peltula sp. TS41687]